MAPAAGRLLAAIRSNVKIIFNILGILYEFYAYFHVVSLLSLLFMLSLIGGVMFVSLELPAEQAQETAIAQKRTVLVDSLQCDTLQTEIQARLELYEKNFQAAVIDGLSFLNGTAITVWELPNAIYFCIITFTLVGYGDLAPKTNLGRIILVVYMGVSVPLNSLVLDEISKKCENIMIWLWYALLECLGFLRYLYDNTFFNRNKNNPVICKWHETDHLEFDDDVPSWELNSLNIEEPRSLKSKESNSFTQLEITGLHKAKTHHFTPLIFQWRRIQRQRALWIYILMREHNIFMYDLQTRKLCSNEMTVSQLELYYSARTVICKSREKNDTQKQSGERFVQNCLATGCWVIQGALFRMHFRYAVGKLCREKMERCVELIWFKTTQQNRAINKNNSAKIDAEKIDLSMDDQPHLSHRGSLASATSSALGDNESQVAKEDQVPMVVHFIALGIYTFLGSFALKLVTQDTSGSLNFLESCWFFIISFTTAGYGDLVPEQKIFHSFLPYIFIGICLMNNVITSMMKFFAEVGEGFKTSAIALQDFITSKRAGHLVTTKRARARRNWFILKSHVKHHTIPKKLMDESAAYKASLMSQEREFVRRAYRIYFYEVFKKKFKGELNRQLKFHLKLYKQREKAKGKGPRMTLSQMKDIDDDSELGGTTEDRRVSLFGKASLDSSIDMDLTWWQRFKRWVIKTYFKGKKLTIRGYLWTKANIIKLWSEYTGSDDYEKHLMNRKKLENRESRTFDKTGPKFHKPKR